MSDPFRDAMHSQQRDQREYNEANYTPIVLWVRTTADVTIPRGMADPEERARRYAQMKLDEVPLYDVITDVTDEPASTVITEFDEDPSLEDING